MSFFPWRAEKIPWYTHGVFSFYNIMSKYGQMLYPTTKVFIYSRKFVTALFTISREYDKCIRKLFGSWTMFYFVLKWKKYHLADTLCIWMQALFSDVISFFNKLQILIDFHVQMFWMLNLMKLCIYIFISQTYYCFWIAFYFWILRSSKSFNVIMYVGRFNQDGNLNHISFWTLYICSDW